MSMVPEKHSMGCDEMWRSFTDLETRQENDH